jgi:hypothetical protein
MSAGWAIAGWAIVVSAIVVSAIAVSAIATSHPAPGQPAAVNVAGWPGCVESPEKSGDFIEMSCHQSPDRRV